MPMPGISSYSGNATSFYKQTQASQQPFLHESAGHDVPTTAASGEGKETLDIRAALWSLGHIGASELGYTPIQL